MNRLISRNHSIAYLDVSINKEKRGRIAIELIESKLPNTCENFKAFITGNVRPIVYGRRFFNTKINEYDLKDEKLKKLQYKGCPFHRVIPNYMIQTGDVLYHNGYGCITAFDSTSFDDESYEILHDRPGIVSMANKGPNTNGCQFFITTRPCSFLDGRNVAFGRVVCGYEFVKEIEQTGTPTGTPICESRIEDCGLLDLEEYVDLVEEESKRLLEKMKKKKEEMKNEYIEIIKSLREGRLKK